MTEATMPVTVEQCDRDAAADLFRTSKWFTLEDVAEALARHRMNTRATPPSPAGLALRKAIESLTLQARGNPITFHLTNECGNAILTALTANGSQPDRPTVPILVGQEWLDRNVATDPNAEVEARGSQPDRVVDVLPAALAEQACLIGKSGTTVTIECDDYDEALAVFDWITLLSTLTANASQPDRVVDVLREARQHTATLAMYDSSAPLEGRFVSIPAIAARRAKQSLAEIDATLDAKDQSND